jgi:cyanophycinase
LRGSLVWQTMLGAWRGGAVLAGSSAGAMVLCAAMWDPYAHRIETALGVVHDAAVIPHHRAGSEWVKPLCEALGQDLTLLGIAEHTDLIWDGSTWRVAGPGDVTVYWRGQATVHRADDTCALDGVSLDGG